MNENKKEICAHCKGTGTCSTGIDEFSCHECARSSRFWLFRFYAGKLKGCKCSRCEGDGSKEPYTQSLNERVRPALAIVLLPTLIIIPVTMHESAQFTAILAFCSSLAGSMVTYFFGSKRENVSNKRVN